MIRQTCLLSFVLLLCACTSTPQANAQMPVRFHNEEADTARINQLLIDVEAMHLSPGDAVVEFGSRFLGTPYVGHTLEHDPEMLTVNLDELDCTTFVETMAALALTVEENRTSWHDFVYNLRNIRYRNGKVDGYPSRLHYISDWAIENANRGNFKEVTADFPRVNYSIKTINFMSANADKYKALADSANLEGILGVEGWYRGHRFPYVKTRDLASKDVKNTFRNGDLVGFTTKIKNLDVVHMGIVVVKNGVPYVMHASSSGGKVLITEVPIDEFVKRNTSFTGVRVFRLQ